MVGAGEKDGTFRDVSYLSLSPKLASKYKAMNVDTTSAHSFKVITRFIRKTCFFPAFMARTNAEISITVLYGYLYGAWF